MRVTFEKHQKELTDKLERSTQENEALEDLRGALQEERLRVDELQVALGEAESERDSLNKRLKEHHKLREKADTLEEK